MQGQPIVADEKQDAVTRLCLVLAGADGIIALVTVVIPLIVLGERAFTRQILMFIVPCCLGIAITVVFFVWALRRIEKR